MTFGLTSFHECLQKLVQITADEPCHADCTQCITMNFCSSDPYLNAVSILTTVVRNNA